MAKIKLHNPELAINSVFKNLVIESFSIDPIVSGVETSGRLWFNSTDKLFKGAFLNEAGTDVVVKDIGIDNTDDVSANTDAIAQEATDRATADDLLQDAIDATDADLAQEVADRGTADTTLTDNLAQEVTDRGTADTALQTELDASQTTIGASIATDGTYVASTTTNYLDVNTSITEDIRDLDTQAKVNADAIIAEASTRGTADTAIQAELDASQTTIGASIAADGTYVASTTTNYLDTNTSITEDIRDLDAQAKVNADAIITEASTRGTADTALDGRITDLESAVGENIGDLTSLTTDAKDTLVNAINEVDDHINTEVTDRGTADGVLQDNIDTLATDVGTNYLSKTSLTDQSVAAITTFEQDLVVTGNLVISGTTTTVNTEQMTVADNIITLNSDVLAETVPTENAGIEINRGTEGVNTLIQWNEAIDQTEVLEAGELRKVATTNYVDGEISTLSTALQTELDDTQTGAGLNTDGSYIIDGTTTYLTGATDLANADKLLDVKVKLNADNLATEVTDRGTADTAIQSELDASQTTIGASIAADGTYVASTTTNYIDGNTSITEDIRDLDVKVKLNADNLAQEVTDRATADTNLQTELDASQTTIGASIAADGTYVASTTTNYIDGNNSITEDIRDLDVQVKVNTDGLATEVTDRTDADTALDTRVTDLESAVGANIGDLTTLDTDAKDNLVNAINEVNTHSDTNAADIVTEINTRATADTNLQTELDASQTTIGASIAADGTYVKDDSLATPVTNYLQDNTSITEDIRDLDTVVKTNETNVGTLSTLTTDAKDTIVNAINEVDANINTEVTARANADTTLTNNLATEVTNRTDADTAIKTAAGIETDGTYIADGTTIYLTGATDLMNADKLLDSAINTTNVDLASTADAKGTSLVGYEGYVEADVNIVNPTVELAAGTLKDSLDGAISAINTKIHDIENKYVKGEVADADKSDTYTLAHNLDTEFVDVSIQVYDVEEAVWRFDLVVIEVIDANVVKISLASGTAEQIRYVIQGY